MPEMMDLYFNQSLRPSVRYFQGKEGLEAMYKDQLAAKKDVHFIRLTADINLFAYEDMRRLRGRFAKSNVNRYVFSPDAADVPTNWRDTDGPRLLHRTWMKENDYTAPVEWDVYGDKVAIISFGEETVGVLIESPQISESLRQIFAMLERGQKLLPEYSSLPLRAAVTVLDNDDLV